MRTQTAVFPGSLFPSGFCFSVPFFALPSFSLLGHGTFQDCSCLCHFPQSSPPEEEHEDERDTRCMVSELKEAVASDFSSHSSLHSSLSSSTKGRSSRLPLIIHPPISLFTPHFLCVLCRTFATDANMHDLGVCSHPNGPEIMS